MSIMGTRGGRKQHTAELKAKVAIAALKELWGQSPAVCYMLFWETVSKILK